MARLQWLLAPSSENLSFAVRTCVSVALVLYLAFWLQLDNAYWAFINIAILIQPLPGYLVVRGFARLVGTVVAGIVSIMLIAFFAQSYTLFSFALIGWVSAMVFLASLFRNNLSYGFVLAGYVTAIIGVRAMGDPTTVFSVAMARTAETALATVVAAAVSVLLAPGTTARKYLHGRVEAMRALGGFLAERARSASEATDADNDDAEQGEHSHSPSASWFGLIAKTINLEQTRLYARFDAPGFDQHERMARRLNYELLSLVSEMASLHTYLRRSRGPVDRRPLAELTEAADQLNQDPNDTNALKAAFGSAYERIQRWAWHTPSRPRSIGDWVVISRALDLANQMRAAVVKHEMLLYERVGRTDTHGTSEFDAPTHIRGSLRTTFRAGIAMAAGAAIWATHADPALAGTMVLLSVLTTLFALGDNPEAGARGFGVAVCIAGAVAFIVNFWLLPLANSYASLMLVILPVVFVAALAMATPAYALIGRVGLVIFALLVHPANGARQTFVSFAETFMGICLAVLVALVAFKLVLPISPRALLRERTAHILRELARGFGERREHFETRVYERIQQLPVNADQGAIHSDARQAAFSAANIGLEARTLMLFAGRAAFTRQAQDSMHSTLDELQQLFAHSYPSPARVAKVRNDIDALADNLLAEALAFKRRRRRRYGVRAAVGAALLASALADYAATRDDPELTGSAEEDLAHAT
ncbi:FUSC family protein [Salinisphaera sp. USBA-960]|uniref:FUSC family protein n=1 Tax=Salinisphaera orenii TaxID=856731 RepID=UPI000DBE1B5A|nr:FUSC family protein [Salifodinibacter halophilus]NNC26733.1 FUSC family protein [Salifodinibacter halophilus]